jgi:hypothetical protein
VFRVEAFMVDNQLGALTLLSISLFAALIGDKCPCLNVIISASLSDYNHAVFVLASEAVLSIYDYL